MCDQVGLVWTWVGGCENEAPQCAGCEDEVVPCGGCAEETVPCDGCEEEAPPFATFCTQKIAKK